LDKWNICRLIASYNKTCTVCGLSLCDRFMRFIKRWHFPFPWWFQSSRGRETPPPHTHCKCNKNTLLSFWYWNEFWKLMFKLFYHFIVIVLKHCVVIVLDSFVDIEQLLWSGYCLKYFHILINSCNFHNNLVRQMVQVKKS
jgi:hypothetical protein